MATIQEENEEAKKLIFMLKNNRYTYTEIAAYLGYEGHSIISRIMSGRANVTRAALAGLRELAEEYCK